MGDGLVRQKGNSLMSAYGVLIAAANMSKDRWHGYYDVRNPVHLYSTFIR